VTRRTLCALLLLVALALPSGARAAPATLDQFWAGQAHFEPYVSLTLAGTAPHPILGAGADVVIVDGTWYLFDRTLLTTSGCGAFGAYGLGTEVRASSDAGRTWGVPVPIVVPVAGTPWSCAATDGSLVYQPALGRWLYIAQCARGGGAWGICTFTRDGASPLGPFRPDGPQPVHVSAPINQTDLLWTPICGPTTRCWRSLRGQPVGSPGTFDIIGETDAGWLWVSYVGATPGGRAARAVALVSPDARTWLPLTAMLTAYDAAGIREDWAAGGPIGVGAGSTIDQDGRWYTLAEAPDESIACTAGQHWDLALWRAGTLTDAHWDLLPSGLPLVYSSLEPEPDGRPQGCNATYPLLFTDPAGGETFMAFTRVHLDPSKFAFRIYRLVPGPGPVVVAGARPWLPCTSDPGGCPD